MKTRPFLKPAIKNYFIFVLLIWITACSNQTMKITTEFEKIFDAKFSEGEPGGVILVKKGEEVIFLKSYGIADLETKEVITPHTIFNTGSVSKTMVSNGIDRKSTRLNSSHVASSYAVFCLKKRIAIRGSARLGRMAGSGAWDALVTRTSSGRWTSEGVGIGRESHSASRWRIKAAGGAARAC